MVSRFLITALLVTAVLFGRAMVLDGLAVGEMFVELIILGKLPGIDTRLSFEAIAFMSLGVFWTGLIIQLLQFIVSRADDLFYNPRYLEDISL